MLRLGKLRYRGGCDGMLTHRLGTLWRENETGKRKGGKWMRQEQLKRFCAPTSTFLLTIASHTFNVQLSSVSLHPSSYRYTGHPYHHVLNSQHGPSGSRGRASFEAYHSRSADQLTHPSSSAASLSSPSPPTWSPRSTTAARPR